MCYYKLWIYNICGHSTMSTTPIRHCSKTSPPTPNPTSCATPPNTISTKDTAQTSSGPTNRTSTFSAASTAAECTTSPEPLEPEPISLQPTNTAPPNKACKMHLAHPFQSYKLHTLCPACTQNRTQRLSIVESGNKVRFEDWKWKVKYLSPVPEEARFTGGLGIDIGEWGEAMGSWVRGTGLGLGLGLEGFKDLFSEVEEGGGRGTAGREAGLAVGFRGGLGSS